MSQFVSSTMLANNRKSAATLDTTPSQVANHAATGFKSTLRLMISGKSKPRPFQVMTRLTDHSTPLR